MVKCVFFKRPDKINLNWWPKHVSAFITQTSQTQKDSFCKTMQNGTLSSFFLFLLSSFTQTLQPRVVLWDPTGSGSKNPVLPFQLQRSHDSQRSRGRSIRLGDGQLPPGELHQGATFHLREILHQKWFNVQNLIHGRWTAHKKIGCLKFSCEQFQYFVSTYYSAVSLIAAKGSLQKKLSLDEEKF